MRKIVIERKIYEQTKIHCVKCGKSGVWKHEKYDYDFGYYCICAACGFVFSSTEDGSFEVSEEEKNKIVELQDKLKDKDFIDNYEFCNTWKDDGCGAWIKKTEIEAHRAKHEQDRQDFLKKENQYAKEHGHPREKLFMSSGRFSITLKDE